jgi:large subunit ribosomal protein L29
MKIKDARKLKGTELDKKLTEANTELIILQGQANTGTPPKNPGQIKKLKRTIARIQTLKNEKKEEK